MQPLFARLPVVPEPAVHTSSIELMRELAERNVGVSFQTRIGTEHLLESGRVAFVPLEDGGAPVWADLGVYVRADRALPAFVDSFIQHLVRALKRRETLENSI